MNTTRTYTSHKACSHDNTPAARRRCRDAQALILNMRAVRITSTDDTTGILVYRLPRPVGRPKLNAKRDYLVIMPDARVFRAAA